MKPRRIYKVPESARVVDGHDTTDVYGFHHGVDLLKGTRGAYYLVRFGAKWHSERKGEAPDTYGMVSLPKFALSAVMAEQAKALLQRIRTEEASQDVECPYGYTDFLMDTFQLWEAG